MRRYLDTTDTQILQMSGGTQNKKKTKKKNEKKNGKKGRAPERRSSPKSGASRRCSCSCTSRLRGHVPLLSRRANPHDIFFYLLNLNVNANAFFSRFSLLLAISMQYRWWPGRQVLRRWVQLLATEVLDVSDKFTTDYWLAFQTWDTWAFLQIGLQFLSLQPKCLFRIC